MNFLSIKILWRFPFFSEKNKDEKKCIPFFAKEKISRIFN